MFSLVYFTQTNWKICENIFFNYLKWLKIIIKLVNYINVAITIQKIKIFPSLFTITFIFVGYFSFFLCTRPL